MNTSNLQLLIRQKTGQASITYERNELSMFSGVIINDDILEYLSSCLLSTDYFASDINICNLDSLIRENLEEANPGMFIYPFGYLIVGTSIGGNCVCFHAGTGRVCWADHAYFKRSRIIYKDRDTGDWVELSEYTDENVAMAMIWLSDNIETFLLDLLADELTEQLEKLD